MSAEPLREVRKSLRISWYRCPIERDRLKELTGRTNLKGLAQAIGHLALLVPTGWVTYYLFNHRIWIGFALSMFVHGTVFSFIRAGRHELTHGTVCRTKWLNALLLRVYGLLAWLNIYQYKISHTYHHLYTLHPRGDREVVLPQYPSLRPLYLLQLFSFNVFGGLESMGLIPTVKSTVKLAFTGEFDDEWSEAIFADQQEARRKAVNWARFILLFHLAFIAGSLALRLWLLPVLVTFGIFTANWWRYFVGMPMHNGLRDNVEDFRLCVRTIALDPFSRFLYWSMNYHTEHHMFAAVPCYNLRALHRTVAFDMPKPRSVVQAWREMRQTWRKQQQDPHYRYDTPLPRRTAETGRQKAGDDPLGSSLGGLQPKGLR